MEETKDINRILVMLVEKERSHKWLIELLGKSPAAIFKWCTNRLKPTTETFFKIAGALDINYRQLVRAELVMTPKN